MSRLWFAGALACAAILFALPASAATIDAEGVVELSRAGVPDEVIIQRIRDEGATFELSPSEAVALVDAGVSERVVDYMLSTAPMRADAPPEPPPAPAPLGEAPIESLGDIIAMHEDGATEAELIAAIEDSPPLRLTGEDIDLLRAVGVTEPVLVAAAKRSLDAPRAVRPTRRAPPRRPATTRRPPPRHRPPPSRARTEIQRKRGFQLIGGLGVNVCVADGVADCEEIGPGFAFGASAGYRVNQWFSAALDFAYGTLTLADDGLSSEVFSVQPTLRLHIPAGPLEIHLGGGFGYTSFTLVADELESVTWSSPLSFKFTGGVTATLSERVGLGLGVDFFVHPKNGEICVTDDFDDEFCERVGDDEFAVNADIEERFTMTLMAIFVL